MVFYSLDPEARSMSMVEEPRTVQTLSRIMAIAIERWMLSSFDCPQWDATDGVSETEAAMEI